MTTATNVSIKDIIEKPIVKLMPADNGADIHCYFDVEVRFKPINGEDLYPPLKYKSKLYSIETAESSGNDLIDVLFDKVAKWKAKYDRLNEKQSVVDTFLSSMWGA